MLCRYAWQASLCVANLYSINMSACEAKETEREERERENGLSNTVSLSFFPAILSLQRVDRKLRAREH